MLDHRYPMQMEIQANAIDPRAETFYIENRTIDPLGVQKCSSKQCRMERLATRPFLKPLDNLIIAPSAQAVLRSFAGIGLIMGTHGVYTLSMYICVYGCGSGVYPQTERLRRCHTRSPRAAEVSHQRLPHTSEIHFGGLM